MQMGIDLTIKEATLWRLWRTRIFGGALLLLFGATVYQYFKKKRAEYLENRPLILPNDVHGDEPA